MSGLRAAGNAGFIAFARDGRTHEGALIKLYGRDNVVHLIARALAGGELGKAA